MAASTRRGRAAAWWAGACAALALAFLATGPAGAAAAGAGKGKAPTADKSKPADKGKAAAPAKPTSPREILDYVDDLYRGASARGKMTMKVVTEHWTREMALEFWSKGEDRSLVRILSPAKDKGTASLKSGKDMWNYLPKVKRVVKVPSSMMGGSWMGSHFTNDDLVKESRMADDYTFKTTFEGKRGAAEVIEITCIPKKDAAVVWGKVVVTVRSGDYLPLSLVSYDEGLKLARTMTFSDVRTLGGRTVPSRMLMVPADKPKESTTVIYTEIEFEAPISDDVFSIRTLSR